MGHRRGDSFAERGYAMPGPSGTEVTGSGDVEYVWVGLGGFVGANARYGLTGLVARRLGSGFPFGTLLINVSGSLLIGLILTALVERFVADPAWRLLLVVGFLGGDTTLTPYSFEAIA